MNTYDVIIIGGGTAGCSAAYISGKLGLKTLLIEKGIHLGGAITSGLVVPAMNCGNNQINTDFFNELIINLKEVNGQITYQGNPGWFNPELTKIILDKMMKDAHVEVLFNAEVSNIVTDREHSTILKLTLNNKMLSAYNDKIHTYNSNLKNNEILSEYIEAKYYVDATGNCEFSKKINCEMLSDNTDFQPMSLRFMMSGVNCEKFAKWISKYDLDRNVTTTEYIDDNWHFSTAFTWDTDKHWALAPIFDEALEKKDLNNTDINYFQVFTTAGMAGTVAFNCPRIPESLNPNDIRDVSYALTTARESILRLANFCKKYLPGFENAFISNIADTIGVRVSDRIKGKYIYTIDDLKNGKKFEHPVLISNYPVDVHNKDKNSSICMQTGEYQLPIESLMSADYNNLFVIGRCLSADYMSQGALRVQANCFAMGEGVAKYIKTLI